MQRRQATNMTNIFSSIREWISGMLTTCCCIFYKWIRYASIRGIGVGSVTTFRRIWLLLFSKWWTILSNCFFLVVVVFIHNWNENREKAIAAQQLVHTHTHSPVHFFHLHTRPLYIYIYFHLAIIDAIEVEEKPEQKGDLCIYYTIPRTCIV